MPRRSEVYMNAFWRRFVLLIFGLLLYALGIAITMKANLGFAPWDVFHKGVSNTVGISIGNASIVVGLVICVTVALAGESLGLGSILNMILIGVFLDFILESELLPEMNGVFSGTAMMVFGLFVIAFATYYYMKSGFGAGPRDGLMVVLERRSGLPVGICRAVIESLAVLAGWLMGGPVGLGTLIAAFSIGLCVQIAFALVRFQATEIKHENLKETMQSLIGAK